MKALRTALGMAAALAALATPAHALDLLVPDYGFEFNWRNTTWLTFGQDFRQLLNHYPMRPRAVNQRNNPERFAAELLNESGSAIGHVVIRNHLDADRTSRTVEVEVLRPQGGLKIRVTTRGRALDPYPTELLADGILPVFPDGKTELETIVDLNGFRYDIRRAVDPGGETLEAVLYLGGKAVIVHTDRHSDRNGEGSRELRYTLHQENVSGALDPTPVTLSISRERRPGQVLGDEIYASKPEIPEMQFPRLFDSVVRGITFSSVFITLKQQLMPPQ